MRPKPTPPSDAPEVTDFRGDHRQQPYFRFRTGAGSSAVVKALCWCFSRVQTLQAECALPALPPGCKPAANRSREAARAFGFGGSDSYDADPLHAAHAFRTHFN